MKNSRRITASKLILCLSLFFSVTFWNSTLAAFNGLSSTSNLMQTGKTDSHYRYTNNTKEYNLIWWSPIFKGGVGIIDFDDKGKTKYIGGFLRPLLLWPNWGELITGFQSTDVNGNGAYEFQGEYRLPLGLGLGGGFVERNGTGSDTLFGKVSYRNKWREWNYILGLQGQKIADESSPGGYIALYNKQVMLTFGQDGEQWRTTLGYVTQDRQVLLRPAFEVLWVDNTIGNLDGPQFLFVNATLKFYGGFLSHPARLGRAMGPTGLEFGNPLGFLLPTWNRRLNLEEIGGLVNFRLVRLELPNTTTTGQTEVLVFPFQFDSQRNMLDSLFFGGFYADKPLGNSPGILGGFLGKVGFLQVSLQLNYDLETGQTDVVIGVIDKF